MEGKQSVTKKKKTDKELCAWKSCKHGSGRSITKETSIDCEHDGNTNLLFVSLNTYSIHWVVGSSPT